MNGQVIPKWFRVSPTDEEVIRLSH